MSSSSSSKVTVPRVGLALALSLLVALELVVNKVDSGGNQKPTKGNYSSNHYLHLRATLGHFAKPNLFLGMYEEYFNSVIKKNDRAMKDVDINDWRNNRPTGERCINFLVSFQIKNYNLTKPHDIIVLDSCLQWIVDEEQRKEDYAKFSKRSQKKEVDPVINDKKLKEIYESTSFKDNSLPNELKPKLGNYLRKLMKLNSDNPRVTCHTLWLEAYNEFIEEVYLEGCDTIDDNGDELEMNCIHFNGWENGDKDSYFKLIVDSTKTASQSCYATMQKQMLLLLQGNLIDDSSVFSKKLKAVVSSKQSESKVWSKEMIKVIQVVTGENPTKGPGSLAKIIELLSGLHKLDEASVETFTSLISDYATHNLDFKNSANDSNGRIRFARVMTNLCKPFVNERNFLSSIGGSAMLAINDDDDDDDDDDAEGSNNSTRDPFEFYSLIYSLVRLTNHESIYGISKDKFEEDILNNGWQSLYLTTFACHIISTTWAELEFDTNMGSFNVNLRPSAKNSIEEWPISIIESKFPVQQQQQQQGSENSNTEQQQLSEPGLENHQVLEGLVAPDMRETSSLAPGSPARQQQQSVHKKFEMPRFRLPAKRQTQQQQQQQLDSTSNEEEVPNIVIAPGIQAPMISTKSTHEAVVTTTTSAPISVPKFRLPVRRLSKQPPTPSSADIETITEKAPIMEIEKQHVPSVVPSSPSRASLSTSNMDLYRKLHQKPERTSEINPVRLSKSFDRPKAACVNSKKCSWSSMEDF